MLEDIENLVPLENLKSICFEILVPPQLSGE